jgi:hypothetical protein
VVLVISTREKKSFDFKNFSDRNPTGTVAKEQTLQFLPKPHRLPSITVRCCDPLYNNRKHGFQRQGSRGDPRRYVVLLCVLSSVCRCRGEDFFFSFAVYTGRREGKSCSLAPPPATTPVKAQNKLTIFFSKLQLRSSPTTMRSPTLSIPWT